MKEEEFIEMLNGCYRKEHKAQALLYNSYCDFVYLIISRFFEDDFSNEYVLSTTFEKVFYNIETLNEKYERGLCGWIKKIAINQAIMYKKKHKKLQLNDRISEGFENVLKVEAVEYGGSEQMDFILQTIRELPNTQKTVFNLRAIDGYSAKEVCEKLNMKISACKSNYSRARLNLQKKIKEKYNVKIQRNKMA